MHHGFHPQRASFIFQPVCLSSKNHVTLLQMILTRKNPISMGNEVKHAYSEILFPVYNS